MKGKIQKHEDFDNAIVHNTYKSTWLECKKTGNFKRLQKKKYPLEWLPFGLLQKFPKFRFIASFLKRNKEGVDAYKYYVDILKKNKRCKWENEFKKINAELEELGYSLKLSNALDVSGEPGFFAFDMNAVAKNVEVTAFASEVARAITEELGIESKKFDFQEDNLAQIYQHKKFDFIFIRYAIGFCENLKEFIAQCSLICNKGSLVYLSFSPASRGVMARWMFEDYVYLRQYREDFVVSAFEDGGFELISRNNQGSFRWDEDMSWVQKKLTSFYTKNLFSGCGQEELDQHNISLVFKMI